MAKNYHRSSIHIQIHDLGHFLGKIMTLLNLYLVLLLEWSIVTCKGSYSIIDERVLPIRLMQSRLGGLSKHEEKRGAAQMENARIVLQYLLH